MKAELLTLLRQTDTYLSGQELCKQFGVTRTAVWKAINQLKIEGYEIEAVPNKGYRLLNQPDTFSENEIKSRIHTDWAGKDIVFYDTVDSTNLKAKMLAEEGARHGTLVAAGCQTAGRGRKGRQWDSPPNVNIYASLLLRPTFAPQYASMLTLIMALAVRKAIAGLMDGTDRDHEPLIKWPNDIVMNGRKVTGILTEMSLQGEDIQYVVIGFGMNVKKQEFAKDIVEKATTIETEADCSINRGKLLATILDEFEHYDTIFQNTLDLSGLMEEYNTYLVNNGKEVRVLDPAFEYIGHAMGINNKGELLVQMPDGTAKNVYAGEVSVRGIYGYV